MDRAKFAIVGETPAKIIEDVRKAVGDELGALFFPDAGLTFFDLLTPSARTKLISQLGTVHDIQKRYREFDVMDEGNGGDDEPVTPEMLVEAAAIANPNVYFRFHEDGFTAEGEKTPMGYVVPCELDPALLRLPATEVGSVQIAFGDDGAPAQQHRDPGRHGGATFLTRSAALRAINRTAAPARKTPVHVFLIDQGMNRDYVDALGGSGTYGGIVWDIFSGSPAPETEELPTEHRHRYRSMPHWHAHMLVRNILSVAGDNRNLGSGEQPIKFYDIPVIPNRVDSVTGTALSIWFKLWAVLFKKFDLPNPRNNNRFIIVNAWGVKNRLREGSQGSVTEDRLHPLNTMVSLFSGFPDVAVVFAAGNTGLFTPDPEASPYDRGPGRSIWFPNALDSVLNTGASDVNGQWIGASSQGRPVVAAGVKRQPQFSAPSYFREDLDAHITNTGSSASCGLLAGLVAKRWREDPRPLDIAAAQAAAGRHGHTGHSPRLGWGVIRDKTL